MERSDLDALRKARESRDSEFQPVVAPTYSLADRMLAGHERTFTVRFKGRLYPLWKLVEHLAYIQDKDDNNVRFRYNYQQCLLYLELCKAREEGRQPRVNILKARQIGFSTMVAVQSGITALFTANVKVGIIADTEEHASGLFDKVQYVYDHLDLNNPHRKLIESNPKEYGYLSYKPTLKYNKGKKMLQTLRGNSVIEVMCVSDSAGRSKHYTILHCSEVAFWKITEKALLALFKTVSRTNPNSVIYLETTANGFNEYKMRWDRDFAGGNASFSAFFAPWFDNPEYSMPVPLGFDLMGDMDQWEIDKMRKHNLSMEQMHWFHLEYLDSGRNRDFILQEDPFDPVDAFISTGNSAFNKDLIDMRKREIVEEMRRKEAEGRPCKRGRFLCEHVASRDQSVYEVPEGSIKWADERDGAILILQEPEPGHPYVALCDPNMGGIDDIAIQIIDNHTGVQCARFKSNAYSNEKAAWQLYCLARHYNWAMVSCETNVGQIVMELIVKAKYPKLYVTQAKVYQNYTQMVKTSFGHKITGSNRQLALDSFASAFEENPYIVGDYDTICEMETFENVARYDREGRIVGVKQEAAGGTHDDLVMAFAAFYIVRNQQTSLVKEEYSQVYKKDKTFEEIEAEYYKLQETREKQMQGENPFGTW